MRDGVGPLESKDPAEWRRWELDSIWKRAKKNLDFEIAELERGVARQERGRIAHPEQRAAAQELARLRKAVAEAQRQLEELDVFRQEIVRMLRVRKTTRSVQRAEVKRPP
jgi:hypothetical protein